MAIQRVVGNHNPRTAPQISAEVIDHIILTFLVFTFADGVSVQAVNNSSGQWEFPDLKAPEAGKDDAPPESSARELYTYENGDTFDHDTGVFTYLQGTSVQYVRNSSGEWVAPDSK